MAKHSAPGSSLGKKALAASSLFALSATPLVLFPGSGLSSTACSDVVTGIPGAEAETLANNVCQLSFTLYASGIEIPTWVTKLSVVAIAGGAGSDDDAVGYAGGGGQFVSLDDVSLDERTLEVSIGAAGTSGASPTNGGNTTVKASTSPATSLILARGGLAGADDASATNAFLYSWTGGGTAALFVDVDPSGFAIAGAGTGSSASYPDGGSGIAIKWLRDATNSVPGNYLDSTLWAEDSEVLGAGVSLLDFEFGEGGSIEATPQNALAGSGKAASLTEDGGTQATAGNGIVIMRFALQAATYTVSYNSNGGSGSMTSQTSSSSGALSPNSFSRDGFTFAGWNTADDGSGTSYADGASYPFTANTTLYAQWVAATPAAPTPYSGPVPVTLSGTCLPAAGGTLTLSGERLAGISGATVDGKAATVSEVAATSLRVTFPALEAGTYDVTYQSNSGSITHQDSLRVCATSGTSTPVATPGSDSGSDVETSDANQKLYVYKRFTNYRGDLGGVVEADRRAITDFIKANPGITHVTCVGSTSGVPAIETDPALATARANNACDLVESLIPGVKTRIAINTGLGSGQFYRAVTLFGTGIKSN